MTAEKPRECTTQHHACECREAMLTRQLEGYREKIKELEAEVLRLHEKYDFQILVKRNKELEAENARLKREVEARYD